MARQLRDMREELNQLRFKVGVVQKINCSFEENNKYWNSIRNGYSLPNNVYQHAGYNSFYTIYDPKLTEAERQEYIQYRNLLDVTEIKDNVKTIKKCALFLQ